MNPKNDPKTCTLGLLADWLHPKGEGPVCGRQREAVELKCGTVYLCPSCDRQPGYQVDITA